MGKIILAVLLPPFAVWDKGCGTVLLVGLLTLLLWVPGMLAALYIVLRDRQPTLLPTENYSNDIVSRAQAAKSQPLGPTPPYAPANQPPSFPENPPWNQAQMAKPADDFSAPDDPAPPQTPPPPPRPKPPWEE